MAELASLHALTRRDVGKSGPRLVRAIHKRVGQAISEFSMIGDGDRIMVCVSGGKDSYALLDVLLHMQRRAPVRFDLIAVNVDQGWPGYDTATIAAHLATRGVRYEMITKDFASIVSANIPEDKTPCSLCSRLRRGVLYNLAEKLECTAIALGHHMDDLIETLVLNLFYSGKLASMPAALRSDDGRNTVIRPLAFVPEAMLRTYAEQQNYPIVACGCPSCGLPEQKRQLVKKLLEQLEQDSPGVKNHMLAALRNVKPTQLLDTTLSPPPRIRAVELSKS